MESKFIPYKDSMIHYRISGSGRKLLICFHGFAEDARSFDLMQKVCGDSYSIMAFDLPFHGLTEWKQGLDFNTSDLNEIIGACPETGKEKFDLAGYSMGGRISLSYYAAYPEKVSGLFLLAPDGLVVNPWYKLATRTDWGNRLFRSTMKNPGWFVKLLNTTVKLNLVNSSVTKFVRLQVNNAAMREKIYVTWTTLRSFRPDLAEVKELVHRYNTQVSLVFGKYDRIISSGSGGKLQAGTNFLVNVSIIESGHQLLDESKTDLLKNAFRQFSERSGHIK